MSDLERHVTVVVATTEFSYEQDYDDCSHDLQSNQEVFTLDQLVEQPWFVEYLRNKGYYSKDEVFTPLEYLNKFVYEYKHRDWTYVQFTNSLKNIYDYCEVIGVYQEVVGPERLKEFAKWKKKSDSYKEKEKERLAKQLDKKKQREEKAKLRKIAKAKQLLEKEGINVDNQ